MPTDPLICNMCQWGPCKWGDLALKCKNTDAPATVVTVQDMVNYIAIENLKKAK